MVLLKFLAWAGALVGGWYGVRRLAQAKGMPGWLGQFAAVTAGLFFSTFLLIAMLPATEPEDAATAKAPQQTAAEKKEADDSFRSMEACEEAKDAVRAQLKAPSTAKFPGCVFGGHEYQIRADDQRVTWFVIGHVDAQNSYGAMIRSEWIVKLNRSDDGRGGDAWKVLAVTME